MKYPLWMKKLNAVFAIIAGALFMAIALLSVIEALLRGVFSSPTMWTVDISQYLLIIAAFFGSSYAYQEFGHVAVDFVKGVVEKCWGKAPRRVMAIIGNLMALTTVSVLLWAAYALGKRAMLFASLTTNNIQIPVAALYGIMAAGSVVMILTILFIILDLFSDSEKYL